MTSNNLPSTVSFYRGHSEFQRLYTPSAFREERILWRSVIQLNLVRSVRKILDALADYFNALYADSYSLRNAMGVGVGRDDGGDSDPDDSATFFSDHTAHLHELSMRLLPLRHIEQLLIAKLVPPDEEEATHLGVGQVLVALFHLWDLGRRAEVVAMGSMLVEADLHWDMVC